MELSNKTPCSSLGEKTCKFTFVYSSTLPLLQRSVFGISWVWFHKYHSTNIIESTKQSVLSFCEGFTYLVLKGDKTWVFFSRYFVLFVFSYWYERKPNTRFLYPSITQSPFTLGVSVEVVSLPMMVPDSSHDLRSGYSRVHWDWDVYWQKQRKHTHVLWVSNSQSNTGGSSIHSIEDQRWFLPINDSSINPKQKQTNKMLQWRYWKTEIDKKMLHYQ